MRRAATLQDYQRQFARHLRAPRRHALPAGASRARLQVYAELVYQNLEGSLAACFPVCKQLLGMRRWPRLVRSFLAQHQCATPLFRQIPEEFLQFLQSNSAGLAWLPTYLPSLAHYEWIELALSLAEVESSAAVPGDLLAGVPLLAPALVLLSYPYPVQRIAPGFRPRRPSRTPTQLLVFRDADDVVRFVELDPPGMRLVTILQEAALPGAQAIAQVASLLPPLQRPAALQRGHALLHTLQQLGAVVGVSPVKS